MNKIYIKLTLLFLTALFGICVVYLSDNFLIFSGQPANESFTDAIPEVSPKEISPCQIFNIPPEYADEMILVEGTAAVYKDHIYLRRRPEHRPDCLGEPLAHDFPMLELKVYQGPHSELKELLMNGEHGTRSKKEVEIRVTGKLRTMWNEHRELQYVIFPNSIESLSPVYDSLLGRGY